MQSQLGADLFYGSDNPGVVSVNGGRGRSNNYMVNGGDANDIFVNGPAIQPSPDAIEEFRVLTNTFDAEYGRNSGSVVNVVTKSGTNEIHGDFYEFSSQQRAEHARLFRSMPSRHITRISSAERWADPSRRTTRSFLVRTRATGDPGHLVRHGVSAHYRRGWRRFFRTARHLRESLSAFPAVCDSSSPIAQRSR